MCVHLRSAQIAAVLLLICLLPSHGQKATPAKGNSRVFESRLVTDEVVKDNPFSAEGVSEVTQTLSDGTTRSRKITTHLYRSGDGRLRHEENVISAKGIWDDAGSQLRRISVFDPSSRNGFVLDPQQMLVMRYTAGKSMPIPENLPGLKTESLEPQVLEGLTIQGTRRTKVIPAGDTGNAQPFEIVDESWYSPDLHVVLMTKHSEPRTGNVVYQLTHIDRSEPPADLFEVPPGYRAVGAGSKKNGKR